jgi:hypothetical protein
LVNFTVANLTNETGSLAIHGPVDATSPDISPGDTATVRVDMKTGSYEASVTGLRWPVRLHRRARASLRPEPVAASLAAARPVDRDEAADDGIEHDLESDETGGTPAARISATTSESIRCRPGLPLPNRVSPLFSDASISVLRADRGSGLVI